ncbi:MAG TPA: glycosyl hydrolase family 65 protein [Gammaproteobacteria bacterium]|nr:glycosyl hydrolase family 65 protein [Gammaproteobacteria bacterium]
MSDWTLTRDGFDPAGEGLREALCTLGNGYFATRGASAWAEADGVHYPGTYLAGGYDRLVTAIAGREVENEDLVNFPNWLCLRLRIADGAWLRLADADLLEYRQTLDLRRGLLLTRLRFRDAAGRTTRLSERRLVHMAEPHLAALRQIIVAEDWTGTLELASDLDGNVSNTGVARYRELDGHHLELLDAGHEADDEAWLRVRTRQSRLVVALASRTCLARDGQPLRVAARRTREGGRVGRTFRVKVAPGEPLTVDKTVALYCSRDAAISEPLLAARNAVRGAAGWTALESDHVRAWEHLWERFGIDFTERDGSDGREALRALRVHTFHLLQTASPHVMDLDAGVPARGLHGEAYRGHVFWDELFVFPTINLRMPEITRALLMYRYRRLGVARAAAAGAGWRGAMFPWQSGSSGREESQKLHLNPRSGRWIPDNSHLQLHVNAAVVYNVWQYFQVTGDMEFMAFYGAEMLLEIARFWASRASWNESVERFEIRGVMGPDEYHDAYPDASRPGLDNNAYTNVMAVWVLVTALELLERLPADRRRELERLLAIDAPELELWDRVSRRMRVPFHEEGIISQFEGYEELAELDWAAYRERYGDIQRLDRILEAEGDTPNRYRLSKQADVLMLFYLFSSEELRELFSRLDYPFTYETIPRNVQYYLQRTAHGSTLSRVAHARVLSRSDRPRAWAEFREALASDVHDIQGGTTAEGIHLGAMAGTVDLVQRCFTGISTRGDTLWLDPCLPEALDRLAVRIRYRGHALELVLEPARVHLTALRSTASPVTVALDGSTYTLAPGAELDLPLPTGR